MKRRELLHSFGFATTAGLFSSLLSGSARAEPRAAPRVDPGARAFAAELRPWYELGLMPDAILDQVLLFYLGNVWQASADIGECLDTASRVTADDEGSWAREWTHTAERIARVAAKAEAGRHLVSASEAHMRAATYYRAALHRFPEPGGPVVKDLAERERREFAKALRSDAFDVEIVKIPYERTTLPGYFFRAPPRRGNRAPVLIVHQGRDAWAEDCKFLAEGAVKRGYHCLLFEGPGQGGVLRLQDLPFRYDWERVVGPVVDFVQCRRDVDDRRLALMGLSMGGALAPRAAAFERRLKICIANPGVYEWFKVVYDFFDAIDPRLIPLVDSNPAAFDAQIAELMSASALIRWGMKDTLWKHGGGSPSALMLSLRKYTNRGFAERITCRTLVMDGTVDAFAQGKQLYEALRCPKDYMLFTEEDTGQTHCQAGALATSSQRLFDWLEEYL